MSNYNTSLGEWSDGDDDWIFEIDEEAILQGLNDGELVHNIDEGNSEDDETIRNINEDEVLRGFNIDLEHEQTRRGVKRKAENQNVDLSEDDDPIPDVSDEGSTTEDEGEHHGGRTRT